MIPVYTSTPGGGSGVTLQGVLLECWGLLRVTLSISSIKTKTMALQEVSITIPSTSSSSHTVL